MSRQLIETSLVWAKRGNKITRKYRCTTGPRKGRTVADIAQCNAPIDLKKRQTLKRMTAQQGSRIRRKTQKTKRLNPASRLVRQLNK
jgi:hypothetical protein